MESRKKSMLKNDFLQCQDQMDDDIVELCNQVEADQDFNILKIPLLKTILEGEITNSKILYLQMIVKKCRDTKQIDDLETLFEDYNLGQRIMAKCEKESNFVFLDEQLYLLGQLSQSSLLCQATLIQIQIVQCLNKIVDLEIESDDCLMSTFMYLITTFVEPNSRIPFSDIKQFMSIVDKLCKKLRGINYLDIELDLDNNEKYSESKHSLLSRILLFVRYYIDKSQFTANLTLYQNFWIILSTLAFVVQEQYSLRQTALQVISESMKMNDQQLKFDIIEKHPDIFFQLLIIIDHHQQNNRTTDKCIRTQASIIMKQLFCDQSQYIIQNIHLNQISLQFLQLVEREKDRQVLYHQMEALFLLCSNSTFEQCIDLYNNGLLTLLISTYQEMKEWQDFILSKQLIKLTFAVLQHNSSDNRILNFLKLHKITSYLNDIIIHCKHDITCQRANQLLKYIQ
ncbi:unnamed protein product (macronuclear) [Paramecium tetraurelia]|uniref:Ataxin-10 domain-containing protein n=1 Tax=Paramecium tetraurelia TaxID=5888 RepID=A0DUF1_PARTE|nr:uncharacterized protein GSPATT00020340001 [Paramecium tetraurelia]CAK86668.1 unnamed protein product [Paramecium tetraurelia]|eukprot:XP_001454065.1 hypothetical protein (macronuclear) [Paramecium tetraurelia strain d4-2]